MPADVIPDGQTRSAPSREFRDGLKAGLAVALAATPFALLFGTLAVENGLTVFETTLMSAMIYGGAGQMVGIELFGAHIAPWLVILSIFAVNFRHILYSGPFGRRITHWSPIQQVLGFFLLTDPQFGDAERRAEQGRKITPLWYFTMGSVIYLFWVVQSFLGAMFGKMIPDTKALGFDFLLPIYFLGMVMSFRKRPYWLPVVAASAVASVVVYHTVGSPWHVSLGAAAGIALAVLLPVKPPEREDVP